MIDGKEIDLWINRKKTKEEIEKDKMVEEMYDRGDEKEIAAYIDTLG